MLTRVTDLAGACPHERRRTRRPVRRGALPLVALLLAAGGLPAAPSDAVHDVLVLYSLNQLQPANVEGDRGFHETVRASADRPVMISNESLDAPRFGGEAHEAVVATFLRDKYRSRPPDVVVAVGQDALAFLLRHRGESLAHVPVVHAGVDRTFLRSLPDLPDDVVGVPVEYDLGPTLELALRWHPRARRVVLVTGASGRDRQLAARMAAGAARFAHRVTVESLSARPIHEVLERLSGLGDDTVVLTPGIYRDGDGRDFMPRDSVAAMAAASGAPLYSSFSTLLGTGIVGGYMASFDAMGRQAGAFVNQILDGAPPGSLQLPEVVPQALHVDWRQLRRWGVDEGAVPVGAIVHFRTPTLLEAYRTEAVVSVAVIALQAALIGLLLVERRRRHRAERAAETQRLELAHASRLAVAGELAASIAHEINQPLGAILSNSDAADLILESGGDRRDEVRAILADIRRDDRRASEVIRRLRTLLAKQEVERRPFDLNEVVRDVESMLAAEARRRRVALRARTAAPPLTTVGDPVQMQQVLLNLAINAMDAVADLPDERRTVSLSAESVAGGAEVAVRDAGRGIPPEHLPKLFDSFFSTKHNGMGLGLSIAQTLVRAHGGRIRVDSEPGSGTVFVVELPAEGAGAVAAPGRT